MSRRRQGHRFGESRCEKFASQSARWPYNAKRKTAVAAFWPSPGRRFPGRRRNGSSGTQPTMEGTKEVCREG
jgi:hypothetical protein